MIEFKKKNIIDDILFYKPYGNDKNVLQFKNKIIDLDDPKRNPELFGN